THFADGGENLSPIDDAYTNDRAITALALAPNGGIVAGGYDIDTPTVLRYDTDGSLDTSFADAGTLSFLEGGGTYDQGVIATAVTVGGKVMVLEHSDYGSDSLFRLTR